MALGAVRGKCRQSVIGLGSGVVAVVASIALRGCPGVSARVTTDARCRAVRASQCKAGEVVIQSGGCPARRRVTLYAIG